mmetsp:Transcript_147659/g.209719  ORF Transcript_147659/g.209719 Transcript_147659/m.209719 type:complete len:86 (-) Transcript_147659:1389-1646(-)
MYRKKVKKIIKDENGNEIEVDAYEEYDEETVKRKKEEKVKKKLMEEKKKRIAANGGKDPDEGEEVEVEAFYDEKKWKMEDQSQKD